MVYLCLPLCAARWRTSLQLWSTQHTLPGSGHWCPSYLLHVHRRGLTKQPHSRNCMMSCLLSIFEYLSWSGTKSKKDDSKEIKASRNVVFVLLLLMLGCYSLLYNLEAFTVPKETQSELSLWTFYSPLQEGIETNFIRKYAQKKLMIKEGDFSLAYPRAKSR